MATAVVIKNPRSIMSELLACSERTMPISHEMAKFRIPDRALSVLNDIVGALGGEVTMAFDGRLCGLPRGMWFLRCTTPGLLAGRQFRRGGQFHREASNSKRRSAPAQAAAGWLADYDKLRHKGR